MFTNNYVVNIGNIRKILNTTICTISLISTEVTNERDENMLVFLLSAAEEAKSTGRSDEKHTYFLPKGKHQLIHRLLGV